MGAEQGGAVCGNQEPISAKIPERCERFGIGVVAPIWRYAGRASDIDSTDCGDVPNIREVEGLPAILAGHGTKVHCRARWDCSWTY